MSHYQLRPKSGDIVESAPDDREIFVYLLGDAQCRPKSITTTSSTFNITVDAANVLTDAHRESLLACLPWYHAATTSLRGFDPYYLAHVTYVRSFEQLYAGNPRQTTH